MNRFAIVIALFLIGLTVPERAWGSCKQAYGPSELSLLSKNGEQAILELDVEKLLIVANRARQEVLPCLSGFITPTDAAAFHRLMAFEAITQYNAARARAEFHAARKLDPGYRFPDEMAEGELIRLYEESLEALDGELERVYPPENGWITVGGVRNAPRGNETPVIVQVFDASGNLLETRYFQPGEELPMWGRNPLGITAKELGIGESVFKKPKVWYIAGATTSVAAGVLYGFAFYNKQQALDPSVMYTTENSEELDARREQSKTFGVLSLVTGGVALGLGGVGIGFQLTFGAGETSAHIVGPQNGL